MIVCERKKEIRERTGSAPHCLNRASSILTCSVKRFRSCGPIVKQMRQSLRKTAPGAQSVLKCRARAKERH